MKKICLNCGNEKLTIEFNRNKNKNDGFDSLCKKCRAEYRKEYYQKNKEKVIKWHEKYRKKYPKRINARGLKWRENNPEKVKAMRRMIYAKLDKGKRNMRLRTDWLNNPDRRINVCIRSLIWRSLKDGKNGRHWEDLVGYSINDLKKHLESQFKEGMSWDNYGQWHIDHVIPISIFKIENEKSKGFKKAWALENLRPMWAKDNMKKHNKLFAA